jgi:hypothetical protein
MLGFSHITTTTWLYPQGQGHQVKINVTDQSRPFSRVASSRAADRKIATWCRYCRLRSNQLMLTWTLTFKNRASYI